MKRYYIITNTIQHRNSRNEHHVLAVYRNYDKMMQEFNALSNCKDYDNRTRFEFWTSKANCLMFSNCDKKEIEMKCMEA